MTTYRIFRHLIILVKQLFGGIVVCGLFYFLDFRVLIFEQLPKVAFCDKQKSTPIGSAQNVNANLENHSRTFLCTLSCVVQFDKAVEAKEPTVDHVMSMLSCKNVSKTYGLPNRAKHNDGQFNQLSNPIVINSNHTPRYTANPP